MKEEQFIKDFNVPLNYVPKINKIPFFGLPTTIQRRFIEIAPSPQVIALRQTCSALTDETEKIQGEYPVDRFEARYLPISSPIPYNRFRHNRNSNQVEYIAQPGRNTYDPNMLELLNIRAELGLFDLESDQIHEVLERININRVSKVNIRADIDWEDLEYILEKPNVKNVTAEIEIFENHKFKDFLNLLTKCNYIYVNLRVMDLENFELLLFRWAATRTPPAFFHFMVQKSPLPPESYKLEIFNPGYRVKSTSLTVVVPTLEELMGR